MDYKCCQAVFFGISCLTCSCSAKRPESAKSVVGVPGWPPQTYRRPLVPLHRPRPIHSTRPAAGMHFALELVPLHPNDLCGYPSGLEGLGAYAPAQSGYSFHDGLDFCFAQEFKSRRPDNLKTGGRGQVEGGREVKDPRLKAFHAP